MSIERLYEEIETLKRGQASLREKEIRNEIRVGLAEKEITRIVGDFKDIKERLIKIDREIHRAIYIIMGFMLFILAQEFGLLSIIKKVFL